MNSIFEFAIYKAGMKKGIAGILAWLLLSGALLMTGIMLYNPIASSNIDTAFAELIAVFPQELLKEFNLDVIPNLKSYSGYLSVCLQVFFAVGCLYSCYLGTSGLITEESNSSVVFILAQPVSRVCLLVSRFFSQMTILILFNAAIYVLTLVSSQSFVGGSGAFSFTLFKLFAVFYVVEFLYLAFGFLFSVFLSHCSQASAAALLLFLATILFGTAGGAVRELGWMVWLSPYHLFQVNAVLNQEPVSGVAVIACLLISVLCIAAAGVRYRSKDMNV